MHRFSAQQTRQALLDSLTSEIGITEAARMLNLSTSGLRERENKGVAPRALPHKTNEPLRWRRIDLMAHTPKPIVKSRPGRIVKRKS
jgi:hypothetical protein